MPNDPFILIVSADAAVALRCTVALNTLGFRELQIADSMERAGLEMRRGHPAAVLLDESAVQALRGECPMETAVRELAAVAPVVVAAAYARLPEMTSLIGMGSIDFVARTGDFPRMAARLLCRHFALRNQKPAMLGSLSREKEDDFGELLRHEVNNPLTGILGNTELLMARPEQLPPGAIERLQTIADLAVRLREIVRHLSNTWEANHQPIGPM